MKSYQIFQVDDSKENARYILFSGLEMVKHLGLTITRDKYQKVYEGEIEESENIYETLEQIFTKFNIGKKPEGYQGHSLSVSDIIAIDGKFYYCDDYGFEEIEF